MTTTPHPEVPLCGTGISGLDHVLGGGFPRNRLYLVEGDPGAGKTTLALQFLMEGCRRGERVLYVSLSETEEEVRSVAAAHRWDFTGLEILELAAAEEVLSPDEDYSMYHPAEVELGKTTRALLEGVESRKPARVVVDSLSELRLLAQTPLRYRRQIVALKQFFAGRQCTVLLLDDRSAASPTDLHLQSVAHGVVSLQQLAPEFGAERRRVRVVKLRGRSYRGGYHDFLIERGGLRVFPRLVAAEHRSEFERENASSGLPNLDALLGGGLGRGTSALLQGPAGSGKSSIAIQFAVAAAQRGERAAIFMFDETHGTLLARAEGLGMDLRRHLESGLLRLRQVDPAELTPGQFAHAVMDAVDEGARVIVVDTLNGYMNAMPEERFLTTQLHELLSYLAQRGVLTLLCLAQHGLVGTGLQSPVDTSYLADSVILLRYFELRGEVRQAISVVKKRDGSHERTIRELRLRPGAIEIGDPLAAFQGVLTGVPTLVGAAPGGAGG
jgi:circadian clock protein KaiC